MNFILLQSTVPFIMYSRWKCTFQIAPCLLLIHVITQFCYSQVGIFYQFWTICQPQGLRVWPKNKNNSNATPIPVSYLYFAETRAGFSAFLNHWSEWLKKQFHCFIKRLHWWPKHSLFTRSKQMINCLGFQWPDGFNFEIFWHVIGWTSYFFNLLYLL